jgi:predicted AAA+ superfamily ATPase
MTDLTTLWRFNRPKLAKALAERVLGGQRVALFGPRQTGKTSLLREELMLLLQARGALPVYIERWADKTTNASYKLRLLRLC